MWVRGTCLPAMVPWTLWGTVPETHVLTGLQLCSHSLQLQWENRLVTVLCLLLEPSLAECAGNRGTRWVAPCRGELGHIEEPDPGTLAQRAGCLGLGDPRGGTGPAPRGWRRGLSLGREQKGARAEYPGGAHRVLWETSGLGRAGLPQHPVLRHSLCCFLGCVVPAWL